MGMNGMMSLGPSGQTEILDPRAQLLYGRAMRQEPITHGVGLLGRLAALGVAQKRQRSFEEEIADSRLRYASTMQKAGTDPSARLEALSIGLTSPDPQLRKQASDELATMSQIEDKIISTPGGGQSVVRMRGGMVEGAPQPLVQGRAAAPQLLEFKDGENIRTLMFDPETGGLVEAAQAPRATLDRGMTPEAETQRTRISAAGASSVNVMNPTGPAAAIASVDMLVQSGAMDRETGDMVRAGLVAGAAETPVQSTERQVGADTTKRARTLEQLRGEATEATLLLQEFLQEVGPLDAASPSKRAQYRILAENAANAIAKAQGTPGAEPSAQSIERIVDTLPGITSSATTDMSGAFAGVYRSLGLDAVAAGLPPEKVRRLIELRRKAAADGTD
jgi:hypothetical protein